MGDDGLEYRWKTRKGRGVIVSTQPFLAGSALKPF